MELSLCALEEMSNRISVGYFLEDIRAMPSNVSVTANGRWNNNNLQQEDIYDMMLYEHVLALSSASYQEITSSRSEIHH